MSAPEPTASSTNTNPQAADPSDVPSRPSALARYFAAVEASAEPAESSRAQSAWLLDNLVVADVMTRSVVSVRDDTPFKQIIAALADALARFGTSTRTAIETSAEAGDADTSDLFTQVSRSVDKLLWLIEAHAQSGD